MENIPIIIINFNRLTALKMQLESFQKLNFRNIIIIDNNSNYEPLLNYYKILSDIKIIYTNLSNPHDIWSIQETQEYFNDYYVVTDSDIYFTDPVPVGILSHFKYLLDKYNLIKVGSALSIKDIPDHYFRKKDVLHWEGKFWTDKVPNEIDAYYSNIDTTFALYGPGTKWWFNPCIRVAGKYAARHYTWYLNYNDLKDDDKYYEETAGVWASWANINKNNHPQYIA